MPWKDSRTETLRSMIEEVESQASFMEHRIQWNYGSSYVEAKCTLCTIEVTIWLRDRPEYGSSGRGIFYVPCPGKRTLVIGKQST